MIRTSGKLIEQALTATTTCPLPGTGSGRSSRTSVSGPPGAFDKIAFMSAPRRDPGARGGDARFIARDRRRLCQRQADFVQPLHQAVAPERIEREVKAILKRR